MRRFFTPAIALMRRLSYTKKFSLMLLMSLVAIAVVVASLYASLSKEIRTSQRELEGIALATPISHAIQIIQQHRGLSAAIFEGNNEMRDKRAAKERDIVEIFANLEKLLPPNLHTSADWQSIKTNWLRLRNGGLTWTTEENFTVHTHLIEQLLLFKVVVSGEYVLPLDSQIDTSYLIDSALNRLPMALEHLGQIRARGTAILAKKRISKSERVAINSLIAQLGDEIRFLEIDLDKAGSYNTALQNSLSAVSRETTDLAQQVVDLALAEIIRGHLSASPKTFFTATTTAIDKGYAQMYDSLLPTIETLIRARIDHAENTLRTSIGISILLILAAAYMSLGLYYATIDTIQTLARSARAFASGDLGVRIQLGGSDELKQVGDSFNEIADGLSILLAQRQESEARLSSIIETAMDAVVQMDENGIITGWNRHATNIFGWTQEQAIGRVLHQTIIPSRYREAHVRGMERFLTSGKATALNSRIEIVGMHRDGHEIPVELSITAIRTSGQYEFNGFIRDITQQKESEDLIWKQSNYDMLTDLPNRHMFYDRMELEIRKANRTGLKMALLFIDLDHVKEVNDTLGHNMGDMLLVEVARRLRECAREMDIVARLGGDEFILLLPELENSNSVELVAETIRQKLEEPFRLDDKVAYVSASIGISLYPDDATEIEYLLKDADLAMYISKKMGRNRISYFTSSLEEAAQTRRQLINDLHTALEAGQFRIYYQPIVDLVTGRINKAEALIRWQHPERGLVSPAEFIPLAEETGLIAAIGDEVFRKAASQVKHWRAFHSPDFQLSVNMSPVQFHSTNISHQEWHDHLQALELPGQSMVIEITEGLLLEAESGVTDILSGFHNAGIQISIDDFGTGYSSLSYLKKFDIDYLKIDQSFTRNLSQGSRDMALSEAIIVMAHKLGLKVIAEGVETREQLQLLADAGCDYGQGYLFSQPVPAEEFENLFGHAWLPAENET